MPRNFRFVGILFTVAGLLAGVARFKFGMKPDWLDWKLFAFYSEYLESKFMQLLTNNAGEEITGVLLLSGLFLIAFSREKEESEALAEIRLKAFGVAVWINFVFLIGAFLFTFGFAFVYALMANMFVGLISYIIAFRALLYRQRVQSGSVKTVD